MTYMGICKIKVDEIRNSKEWEAVNFEINDYIRETGNYSKERKEVFGYIKNDKVLLLKGYSGGINYIFNEYLK